MGALIGSSSPGQNAWRRLVMAVAIPLGLAGLADGLWWISDRLVSIGPFDRASFGWIVVIPLWIAAPVVAGFNWQPLDRRTARVVAAAVGTLIAGTTALLLWQAVAFPNCETGAIRTPLQMVLPSLAVGATVGGGFAMSGLVSAGFAGQARLIAVILGAAASAATFAAAILVAVAVLLGPACQRPSI